MSSKPAFRSDAAWLIAIGLCAGLLRLAVAWQYTVDPLGQFPWVDEASYWTWAKAILSTGWWPLRPFYQDPLYPYALACLIELVGPDVAHLRMASAVLGAFTPVLVTVIGRVGLGRAEGLVAGWLTVFYGPLIFADGSLEKEGLAAFWTAVSLLLTALVWRNGKIVSAGLSGSAWGVVGLLRSNALLIGPLAALWLGLGGSRQTKPGDRRALVLAASVVVGVLLVVSPVAAINTWISNPRELMGTTWQLGPNFYIGNGPGATGTYMAPPFVRAHPSYEAPDFALEAMRRAGRTLSPVQISNYWFAQGLKQWINAPLESLRILGRKFVFLAHDVEIPDNQDIDFVRIVAAPALRWGFVGFGVVFPLAIIGLARADRTAFFWFLCLSTAVGFAATAVFFVVGRYRVPWVPGVVLVAAAGAVDLSRRIQSHDWKGLAWRLGLLGLPAVALSWHPIEDPAPARWGNQLVAKALADLRTGQLDSAIDHLDLARASGSVAGRQVRDLVAEGAFHDLFKETIDRKLRRISDPSRSFQANILNAHYLRQLPESRARAQSLLEESLHSAPDDANGNREWAMLLLSWEEGAQARTQASKALELASEKTPSDARSTLYLALARSDPKILDRLQGTTNLGTRTSLELVRAILASRANRTLTNR